jgi:hypothetical protein
VFSKKVNWLSQSDGRIFQFGAGCLEWESGLLHTISLEPKNHTSFVIFQNHIRYNLIKNVTILVQN